MSLSPRAVALQGVEFLPRLVAVQGLWPDDDTADEEDAAFGAHRRRSWRPLPMADARPRKRPAKRRRGEEMLLMQP